MAPLVMHLGRVDYLETFAAMRAHNRASTAATPDEIWILEHPPVFTQGLAGKPEHVLDAGDVPVVKIDRGGQVTYHGPGQLVVYLLLNMRGRSYGVKALVNRIEQSVIDLLAEYGVEGVRQAGMPGVYVMSHLDTTAPSPSIPPPRGGREAILLGASIPPQQAGKAAILLEAPLPPPRVGKDEIPLKASLRSRQRGWGEGQQIDEVADVDRPAGANFIPPPQAGRETILLKASLPSRGRGWREGPAKIAAIGLRVANHATYHGLSLNVNMDLEPFTRINPCGYQGLAITQLADMGVRDNMAVVGGKLVEKLKVNLYG